MLIRQAKTIACLNQLTISFLSLRNTLCGPYKDLSNWNVAASFDVYFCRLLRDYRTQLLKEPSNGHSTLCSPFLHCESEVLLLVRSVIWFLAYVGRVEEIWMSAYKASISLYAQAVLLLILTFQITGRKIFWGYLALAKYSLRRTIRTVKPDPLRRISECALIGNISRSIRIQWIVFQT